MGEPQYSPDRPPRVKAYRVRGPRSDRLYFVHYDFVKIHSLAEDDTGTDGWRDRPTVGNRGRRCPPGGLNVGAA